MNQYRRGSTTFVKFETRIGSCRAQLKVENPTVLRTIADTDLLPAPRAFLSLQNNTYLCRGFD
jgi:hypothetical protein